MSNAVNGSAFELHRGQAAWLELEQLSIIIISFISNPPVISQSGQLRPTNSPLLCQRTQAVCGVVAVVRCAVSAVAGGKALKQAAQCERSRRLHLLSAQASTHCNDLGGHRPGWVWPVNIFMSLASPASRSPENCRVHSQQTFLNLEFPSLISKLQVPIPPLLRKSHLKTYACSSRHPSIVWVWGILDMPTPL